jgi:hypothetical protein
MKHISLNAKRGRGFVGVKLNLNRDIQRLAHNGSASDTSQVKGSATKTGAQQYNSYEGST